MSRLLTATANAKTLQALVAKHRVLAQVHPLAGVIIGCVALILGLVLMLFGSSLVALGGIGILAYGILLVVHQDELLATLIVVAAILIDWYRLPGANFQLPIVALTMGLIFILVQFWTQSREVPWTPVAMLPVWLLWLVVAIPAILTSVYLIESVRYWLDVMLTAFVMYLVGTQIAANRAHLVRFLNLLTSFGVLMAIHTLIFVKTGIFILSTSRLTTYLSDKQNFHLNGADTGYRVGSLLLNPDWNGAFLALILFVPLGLCVASARRRLQAGYLVAALLIAIALYYTYSLAALVAVFVGGLAFVLLLLPTLVRRFAFMGLGVFGAVIVGYVALHARHIVTYIISDPKIGVRLGAWTTGLKVIRAYPLTGVGLGLNSYLAREEAYRLPQQAFPLDHPHNSYLELGAMGGVAVLVVFLVLLGGYFRLAIRNYRHADRMDRRLLLGPLVAMVVVTINSFGINEWTLAPLLVPAWLLIGAVTSPYAMRGTSPAIDTPPAVVATPRELVAVAHGAREVGANHDHI